MFWRRRGEHRFEPAAPTDDELLGALLREGSQDAMAQLYNRHGGLVYRFSLRLMQDESAAEEITQDVFLALLGDADRFDPARASLSTWLCGIARRRVWKHLRARERDHAAVSEDDPDRIESPEDDPFITISRAEAVDAVEQGLDALTPALREVVVLCELEEIRYQDAAEILGIPVGTVRSRLHRARRQLALLLSPDWADKSKKEDGQ